ncbi:MAG: YraN family protein [Muribaculaceae bacterium]|nr:YraN family protein [Muribaculaceae bacterium]
MAQHNNLGQWGENLACEKLITEGYAITERNWRCNHWEIDIIAMKGNRIVFVEVKTRSDNYVDPLESIDRKKIIYLARAANVYIQMHDIPHEPQFDIILIVGTPEKGHQLEHIPDAFLPPLIAL